MPNLFLLCWHYPSTYLPSYSPTITRAILFQANLPHYFFWEAILHVTYIINSLSTPILNWDIPYERLYQTKHDMSFLKVFGNLCFSTNFEPHKNKLDRRIAKYIYLRFASNQKGFKVFDLKSKSVFTSRDMVFYETTFPFVETFNRSPHSRTDTTAAGQPLNSDSQPSNPVVSTELPTSLPFVHNLYKLVRTASKPV